MPTQNAPWPPRIPSTSWFETVSPRRTIAPSSSVSSTARRRSAAAWSSHAGRRSAAKNARADAASLPDRLRAEYQLTPGDAELQRLTALERPRHQPLCDRILHAPDDGALERPCAKSRLVAELHQQR